MPPNSQRPIGKTVLLSFSAIIIGSSVVVGVEVLGNVCSQIITSATEYYNAMLKQESIIP
jgi:hypothetical protein